MVSHRINGDSKWERDLENTRGERERGEISREVEVIYLTGLEGDSGWKRDLEERWSERWNAVLVVRTF